MIFEILYIVVITVATVGYGDYTPQTIAAKFSVIILILVTLILVPLQIKKLQAFKLNDSRKKYYVSKADKDHVVVGGSFNVMQIREFMKELVSNVGDQLLLRNNLYCVSLLSPILLFSSIILMHPPIGYSFTTTTLEANN